MASRSKSDGVAKRLMTDLLDEVDEGRARRLREKYGHARRVLSWMREGAGWMARISGPGHAETIERIGKTRVEAIERAALALEAAIPGR